MTHLVFKQSLVQCGSCWGWGASVHKNRVRPLAKHLVIMCACGFWLSVCSFVRALCTHVCEIDTTLAISMAFAEDVFFGISPRLSTDDAL